MKQKLPPSRELRLEDGDLHGPAELIAFDIYSGDAGTLASSMVHLELAMERDRSRSVEHFALMIKRKLILDGYIVVSDIDAVLEAWHEDDVLGIEHEDGQVEPED